MASKVKVTVSLDRTLVRELGRASRKARRPRSQLVEEALPLWRRRQLERVLKEGYEAMAQEDRATAARHARAGWEAIEWVVSRHVAEKFRWWTSLQDAGPNSEGFARR